MMDASEKYLREVLNQGFIKFLYICTAIVMMLAISCYFFGFYTDALYSLLCLPLIATAYWFTKRGSVVGIIVIVIMTALGAAYNIRPTPEYTGPAVSIFLIVAPIIATRFLDPQSGIWALFFQLFVLLFALVFKDIPSEAAVKYGLFAFIDLSLIVGAFIISSNILRAALIKTFESEQELQRMYDDILSGWSGALELRSKETRGHTDRVTKLTLLMAASLGVAEKELPDIRRGALLHDIGKTGIPDHILLKPGPLSKVERDIMRLHPTYAYQWLKPFNKLSKALEIPYCHHECWDGTGYPRGLRGKEIPLPARIFAIADVYDALTSSRPYRKPMTREQAREYIQERAGIQFDPSLVKVFLAEEEKLHIENDEYDSTATEEDAP